MKKLTGKQKMALVAKHFDEIVKLYPDNSVGLDIHRIDEEDISRKIWDKSEKKITMAGKRSYHTFSRKPAPGRNLTFDITIYT